MQSSACHTIKHLKNPAYLNLSEVYENVSANRELYIRVIFFNLGQRGRRAFDVFPPISIFPTANSSSIVAQTIV